MKRKILLFFVLLAFAGGIRGGELVNIKYVKEKENAEVDFHWQLTEIKIKKDGRDVKIMLNYPYLIYKDSVIRIDTPPFTENGELFISKYTHEKIEEILKTGKAGKKAKTEAEGREKPKKTEKNKRDEPAKKKTDKKKTVKKEEQKQKKKAGKKKKEAISQPVKESGPLVVVIDPGHGGKDPGAIGPSGVKEKGVVLGIGIRVKYNLDRKGIKTYITREKDEFIPLKDRAVFANRKKADLFVSIHCNAARDRRARGTRSYIYSRVASSKEAARAAELENKKVGMFEFLLNDLKKSGFEYLSIEAAGSVQHALVKELNLRWSPTERAPFYVLANTNMPSILVEAAFISNPGEEQKLNSHKFRVRVAQGITDGILEYLEKIK